MKWNSWTKSQCKLTTVVNFYRVTLACSQLFLSVQCTSTFNCRIHSIHQITTVIYMEIFSRRKIKPLSCIIENLKVDECRMKYVVPYYALLTVLNFKKLWTQNEKKENINKSSLWRFLLLFQSVDIAIVLYFCICILQDSCSSYWFKILLTNS